jgi:NifU-like protein involved in Fe-S cluster formation
LSEVEMASRSTLYTTEILRLAASLGEGKALGREDGAAELRSTTCGSRVRTRVQVDASGAIETVSQQVHACAFGQASAAILQQGASGRTANNVEQAITELAEWLDAAGGEPSWPGISALAPARSRRSRHGAILLPFRTLAAALAAAAERRRAGDPPAP